MFPEMSGRLHRCRSWSYFARHEPSENLTPAASPSGLSLEPHIELRCEMCADYEARLQQLQDSEQKMRLQLTACQTLNERYKMELTAERLAKSDVETHVTNLSESTSKQVEEMSTSVEIICNRYEELESYFKNEIRRLNKHIDQVLMGRKEAEDQLAALNVQYERLLGRHQKRAEELRREKIDLPQTVEELQLLCLQLKEELIDSKAALEHLEDALKSEIFFLKDKVPYPYYCLLNINLQLCI
ncbi:unnamed protein product [Soboliphyme baturini]|uniref:Rab5-bind domain-containing protein n=1 Tax=Soboliphyme baturini TaxID=241478 RepID=A0A183IZ19_9BILA|nr:unnamed protein product [Soboliphyme baturini]